jgi:hypothetical protein
LRSCQVAIFPFFEAAIGQKPASLSSLRRLAVQSSILWIAGIDIDHHIYHNYGIYGIHGRNGIMPGMVKKTKYYLDIDPELRNRVKALAALKGKTMRDWMIEAIITKLEDEIDASEGLASLADAEGTISLENYLESRKGKSKKSG